MTDEERKPLRTSAERAAQKEIRQQEADKAMAEYAASQISVHENRERLKALRLARDAKSTGEQ